MENYAYPSYPDSGDSSPRSREIEFENPPPWDEQQPPPNYKAKFMCSYGGKIQARSHDNQLSYVGGETKILAVERYIKFPALLSKLSGLSDSPPEQLTLKYQLPGEELDALISVTNEDDLDHLMHEYDRLYRASSRPARMRIFLFTNPAPDRERFVEPLSSAPLPVQPPNVDFLFGFDKPAPPPPQPPPPPPEPVVPVTEFQPRPPVPDRGIGSDPNANPIEIQRQLQQMQIAAENDQSVYRRRSDDGFSGGYAAGSGTGTGTRADYYLHKMPDKVPPATVPHPAGYWPEKRFSGDGFPAATGAADQPMYVISAPGTFYHTPVVRPQTAPATQGYYAVQRMGSDGYREQPVYGGMPPPKPANFAPAQPVKGPAYGEGYGVIRPAGVPDNAGGSAYAQMAYDSASGRQVYYNAPAGVMHAPQYQGVPPAVSADMRMAGVSLGQDVKVVNKVNQGSV